MSSSTSKNSVSPNSTSRMQPSQIERLRLGWRRGLTPPPRMTVVDWAERFRRLSKESSNGGRFRVSRVEVARGPMMAVTEPGVRKITLMACTQLLKTTFIENVLGYFIHLDPCPILVVQPKDGAADTFSKDRLAPMIRDTKVLRRIFGAAKSRDSGNTLTHKQFPGGHVTMVGANSPTNLAMRPIRVLLCDEVDKYPLSAGNEGPPVQIAEERLAEFEANSLSVEACSPTIAGRSAIEKSYEEGDQRRAYVACPHCQHRQAMEWENVQWDKTESGRFRLETVAYHCTGCGTAWSEAERLVALRDIQWRQTKEFECCGVRQTPDRWNSEGRALCSACGGQAVSNEHASFQASKLYAPKQSLRSLVRKWEVACRAGVNAKKAFWNTQLARCWREAEEAPEWQDVYARKDSYRDHRVPHGVLMLQAGADVQADRVEVGVWGFGRNRERWLIEHRVLPGRTNQPEVWSALADMMDETWLHESGAELSVDQWGIDSGGFTAEVYAFVRSQAGRGNVHAVDGQDSYGAAYLGVGAQDTNEKGKKLRRGLKTIKIGVSFCKQEIMAQLALRRPEAGRPFPPGFVHLPADVTEDVVKQLTSEELTTKTVRGRTRRSWETIEGRRNEVLDCANYARGMAAMRGWDAMRERRFADLEAQIRDSAPTALTQAADAPPPRPPPPPPVMRRTGRSGYMARIGR
ncbi:phage terminase large subunit family protein [Falsiroseomonas tokyonensis]|uniref:Phage terminase large subunit family protein n=1 Tax=Falsiroseomonas tokyonensis TaxID=430521 RepID=A0ABV7BZ54_9PROT|nr:terminase gpA endonuclease subunit [Falsiroseomonas tokyonensis]MBU8540825.1 phage terminase large subunit family protein [Falsiroseomonas tokyonensis]